VDDRYHEALAALVELGIVRFKKMRFPFPFVLAAALLVGGGKHPPK
jgi:hypothetical protein